MCARHQAEAALPARRRQVTLHDDPTSPIGEGKAAAYAITAYVAQGLTCRTALVLAHDDVYRQWAYTALSRGTDRNQLYVIAERADPQAEYAPSRPRDVADRLQADLRRSGAQMLAADEAQALVDKARALERRQRAAERRRVADRDFGRDL